MLASLASDKVDLGETEFRSDSLEPPRELKFSLDDKSKQFIKEAEKNFDDLIGKHQLLVSPFDYKLR